MILDPIGNTFHIWWDDPRKSVESWEADDSWDVLCLDGKKRVIGLEKIGFFPKEIDPVQNMKNPLQAQKSSFLIEGETEGFLTPKVRKLTTKRKNRTQLL